MATRFKRLKRYPRCAIALILILAFLALEAITRLDLVSPVILVPPDQMIAALIGIIADGELFSNLVYTVGEVLASVACAIVIGVLIALLFWRVPFLHKIFEPYLVGLYAMPLVLFYPFALAIFGLGRVPIIVIAAIMGLVPVILNSVTAFKQIPDIYFSVSRVLACPRWVRLGRIYLPAAAPLVFAGFKLCLIYSFIGVVVMEFMTGNIGLGYQIAADYNSFRIEKMYAYVIVIIVLAAIIVNAFALGEKTLRREKE